MYITIIIYNIVPLISVGSNVVLLSSLILSPIAPATINNAVIMNTAIIPRAGHRGRSGSKGEREREREKRVNRGERKKEMKRDREKGKREKKRLI